MQNVDFIGSRDILFPQSWLQLALRSAFQEACTSMAALKVVLFPCLFLAAARSGGIASPLQRRWRPLIGGARDWWKGAVQHGLPCRRCRPAAQSRAARA